MNFPEKSTFIALSVLNREMIRQLLFREAQAEKQPKIAPRSDSFEAILFCRSHGISDGVSGAAKPLTSGFVRTKTLLAKMTPSYNHRRNEVNPKS